MKKLVLLAILIASIAGHLFAQTTATLQLRGVITEEVNIFSSIAETTFIDIRNTRSVILGSIFLSANVRGGYEVTLSSRNGGVMAGGSSGNNESIPYTVSFGGFDNLDLSSSIQLNFSSDNSGRGTEFPLEVFFPENGAGQTMASPGIYEDLLIITISVS